MLLMGRRNITFAVSLKNVVLPKPDKINKKNEYRRTEKPRKIFEKVTLNPTTLGILLSLYMGLRIGELCGLTWADN